MSVSDGVLAARWSGLVVCTRTFRYLARPCRTESSTTDAFRNLIFVPITLRLDASRFQRPAKPSGSRTKYLFQLDLRLSFGEDYREATRIQVHQPEQLGNVMVFLNSAAACGVNGTTLIVDSGHAMASLTNAFPPGKAIMDLITGRVTP